MEKFIQILVFSLFGAGVASWVCMMAFWSAAAFFCMTPEAKERFWWNPYNGTLNQLNLTERGQRFRRLAIRCLIMFISFPICGMIVGVVSMLAFSIPIDRPDDKNVDDPSSGITPHKQAEQAAPSNP